MSKVTVLTVARDAAADFSVFVWKPAGIRISTYPEVRLVASIRIESELRGECNVRYRRVHWLGLAL